MDGALDFANLFVDNDAGVLFYFLCAVAVSLAALLVTLDQTARSHTEIEARRYLGALVGVMFGWGVLAAGSLAGLIIGSDTERWFLPPLERAVYAAMLLLLTWAFLAAESTLVERGSRRVLLLCMAGLFGSYLATLALWTNRDSDFNQHVVGLFWTILPIFLALGGLVLLVTRYSDASDIPLKIIFFIILSAAQSAALIQIAAGDLTGDSSGVVRAGMLLALALTPALAYRMVINRFREVMVETTGAVTAILTETMPLMAPPPAIPQPNPVPPAAAAGREAISLLKILGIMLAKSTPAEIPSQIVQAALNTFKADVVGLAAINDPHWADLIAAYDMVKGMAVPGLALNLDRQETIAAAIELKTQVTLIPSRNPNELSDLFHRLDVPAASYASGPLGPAYIQPLSREHQVIGLLMIAMPYSARALSDSERGLLEALGPIAARLLAISREAGYPLNLDKLAEAPIPEDESHLSIRQELQAMLEQSQQQVTALSDQIAELKEHLNKERSKLAVLAENSSSDLSITQQIRTLSDESEKLGEQRKALMDALSQAQTVMASATADTDEDVYRQMIDNLQSEKTALEVERRHLQSELAELRGVDVNQLGLVVQALTDENERLAADHARLENEVHGAQAGLAELGIEGGLMGFAQLVAHLTEERNRFLKESKRAMAERDMLIRERDGYRSQREQGERISGLQMELVRVAADREAVIKQRDALQMERDALNLQRDEWLETRVRLTEQYEILRRQAEKNRQALENFPSDVTDSAQVLALEEDRSRLDAELMAAHERIGKLEIEVSSLQNRLAASPEERQTAETIVGLTQELRSPLTSIMGYSDLLLGESMGILGETQRQFLLRIQVNVEQLMTLIEDIIRVLAIDHGNLLLAPRKVDVEDLIDDAITASSAQYREKGLALHLDIAPELPPVLADRDALQQIISRLLTNAYLASPPDSAVGISAAFAPHYDFGDRVEDAITFAITDQGGGIPDDDHTRVFQRHYRAENTLIIGLGDKGAGLSVARALVVAHGGRIWVETQPNTSTTFRVALPIEHPFGEKDSMRGKISRLIDAFEVEESQ